ncbi:MAG: hypothetical protein R3330_08685, partial [Saprospiraceae bacterium]|nr:hypothetical protein [Saprospiraceae bacterium]
MYRCFNAVSGAWVLLCICIVCGGMSYQSERFAWPATLSEWSLFTGELQKQVPSSLVIPYDVRNPLYSDYAFKQRFIALPADSVLNVSDHHELRLPEGTVLVKTFYYPADFRQPEVRHQLMETRLLVLHGTQWRAASYAWNSAQTDADLVLAGAGRTVQWRDTNGKQQSLRYLIPNANQCTNCHAKRGAIQPLGVTLRQLNHDGQLESMKERGVIAGLPATSSIATIADYRDARTGDLAARARAYLDANCGHCHAPDGSANSSGLYLHLDQQAPHGLGVLKPPVA